MKLIFCVLAALVVAVQASVEDLHINASQSSTPIETSVIHVESTTEKPEKKTSEEEDDDDDDAFVSKLEILLVEVNDEALQKCILGNLTEDLVRARKADEEMEECYEPAADAIISTISDADEMFNLDVLKNVSKVICRTIPPLREKCLTDYYNNIESCLSDSDMKGIKLYEKMISAGMEYICHYDPDTLIEAAQNNFGCQPTELIAGLVFCIVPPFQEVVRNHNTSMAIPRVLMGKGCRLYKDMAQCVHKELSTCKNATLSNIIVELFNITANTLPECPSERTEWEQYMGRIVGQLYKEEQTQSKLLNTMKLQLDKLIAANDQQLQFHLEENAKEENQKNILNSIVRILITMQAERSSHH